MSDTKDAIDLMVEAMDAANPPSEAPDNTGQAVEVEEVKAEEHSDSEDGDYGNEQFKNRNTRIYGQKFVPNNTDFRSTTEKTETTFSAEVFRQWDTAEQLPNGGIDFPLGINYAGATNTSTGPNETELVNYIYNGVKTKPKLMWYLQGANVFNDYSPSGITYNATYPATTYNVWIGNSSGTTYLQQENIPTDIDNGASVESYSLIVYAVQVSSVQIKV